MNKGNKKFVISISACVLALVLLIVGIVLVVTNSKYKGEISLEDTVANAGDTVSIPLRIAENPGIWGGQLIYTYDANALEYVSCANGNVFDECLVNDKNGTIVFLITQQDFENTEINDIIATVKFKVNDDAASGDYEIAVDEASNFCDKDGEYVYPRFKTGIVTVEE